MMDRAGLRHQLLQLRPALESLETFYCLIGGAAVVLHGTALEKCNDIDILTTERGAQRLASAWRDQWHTSTHAKGREHFRSEYARYVFPYADVEVMGDLQIRQQDKWEPVIVHEIVKIDGIATASLGELQRLFECFGRKKDHEKLAFLTQTS